MIVHNLNIMGSALFPSKTDAPLLVDPDAELAFTITAQGLQMIGWRHSQIIQRNSVIQIQQTAARLTLDGPEFRDCPVVKKRLRLLAFEGLDHLSTRLVRGK